MLTIVRKLFKRHLNDGNEGPDAKRFKKSLKESVEEALQCGVCHKRVTIKYKVCCGGHLACYRCVSRQHATYPVCRRNWGSSKLKVVRKIIKILDSSDAQPTADVSGDQLRPLLTCRKCNDLINSNNFFMCHRNHISCFKCIRSVCPVCAKWFTLASPVSVKNLIDLLKNLPKE